MGAEFRSCFLFMGKLRPRAGLIREECQFSVQSQRDVKAVEDHNIRLNLATFCLLLNSGVLSRRRGEEDEAARDSRGAG